MLCCLASFCGNSHFVARAVSLSPNMRAHACTYICAAERMGGPAGTRTRDHTVDSIVVVVVVVVGAVVEVVVAAVIVAVVAFIVVLTVV